MDWSSSFQTSQAATLLTTSNLSALTRVHAVMTNYSIWPYHGKTGSPSVTGMNCKQKEDLMNNDVSVHKHQHSEVSQNF